jgi:septum site-determining protein MinC
MAVAKTKRSALEFKGSMLTVMILHVYETDAAKLTRQLEQKVAQAPGMFESAPVIIELKAIQATTTALDMFFLLDLLKRHRLIPIGVRGGNDDQHTQALAAGLSVLPAMKSERPARVNHSAHSEELPSVPETKLINSPVRSGQQVVAKTGSLVILSMVSPGAEVLAAGDIHVYGALRGRALAGFAGNTKARIFCHQFDAELVAIAGHYQVNEDFDNEVRKKAVQVYLEYNILHIKTF